MTALASTSHAFVLDAEEAARCLVGTVERNSPLAAPPQAKQRYPFAASRRGDFIRGLLELWTSHAVPVLVSRDPAPPSTVASGREPTPPRSSRPVTTPLQFDAEAVVCALCTSGSTGEPQEFDKSAQQIFGEALAIAELLGLSEAHCALATTAPHHLYGLLFGVLAPLAGGARIIASPKNDAHAFHPDHVAHLATLHQATHLISVPAHLRALLTARIELSSVTTIISSAAPLHPKDAKQLEEKFGAEVIDVLGSTETGGIATRRAALTSCWTPLPGVRVRLDQDQRLVINSPFLKNPEREERSDERARVHADGAFEYLGRSDDIVKVGGKRISLAEIERHVRAIEGVEDCVCGSRPVPGLRGSELLLLVAPAHLKKEKIRGALLSHLEPTFVPRKIRLLEKIPRDERGKVKRSELLHHFERPPEDTLIIERELKVPGDWIRFSGHFEGDPILPALSQLNDFILPEVRRSFGGGALVSMRRVKWMQSIRPGAHLRLRLEQKPQGVFFQVMDGETLACSGTARLSDDES